MPYFLPPDKGLNWPRAVSSRSRLPTGKNPRLEGTTPTEFDKVSGMTFSQLLLPSGSAVNRHAHRPALSKCPKKPVSDFPKNCPLWELNFSSHSPNSCGEGVCVDWSG